MPRVIVLGCGTGVGKSWVSVALLREFVKRGTSALGLKPVESGILRDGGEPIAGSDAAALAKASSRGVGTTPLYALRAPVSPHLAARLEGIEIKLSAIDHWVASAERTAALYIGPQVSSSNAGWTIIETAGGVFSPLGAGFTNFELAQTLEPALWLLVASDSLGVLHDVSATLQAMRARGRSPDFVLLSTAREPDASTGSNARELALLNIVKPCAVLARNDCDGIGPLVDELLGADGPKLT